MGGESDMCMLFVLRAFKARGDVPTSQEVTEMRGDAHVAFENDAKAFCLCRCDEEAQIFQSTIGIKDYEFGRLTRIDHVPCGR